MIFNEHRHIKGSHAFLSASKYHWINYSDEKLVDRYHASVAAARGTELHEFAAQAITLGIKLRGSKATLNQYVNDAIGYGMIPEQVLYYSQNAFGTADAIKFHRAVKNKKPLLRIHDLKTGVTPTSMIQLEIYAAFFCLEYDFKPTEIDYELRIYQNDEVIVHVPEMDVIAHTMDRIVTADQIVESLKIEGV